MKLEAGEPRRYLFLDGLRGWGAVSVVLFHVLVDGIPANATMANLSTKVFLLNGPFAVAVFFIERRGWAALGRLAVARYLRLAIPIFAICLVVHLFLVSEIIPPAAVRPEHYKTWLNKAWLSFDPTVSHLLRFALVDV